MANTLREKRVISFSTFNFFGSENAFLLKTAVSIFDQVAISATNFLVNFILLKHLQLSDYGLFSFLFSILLVSTAIVSTITNTPMYVQIAEKSESQGNQYISSLFVGQIFIFSLLAIVLAPLIYYTVRSGLLHCTLQFCAIFLFAIFCTITREFFKPVFYSRPKATYVVLIDFIYILVYLIPVVLISFFGQISLNNVYSLIGGGAFIATLCGLYLWRDNFKFTLRSVFESLQENWTHSKWILPSVVVSTVSNYSFLYFLIYLVGQSEAGLASATRLTIMPIALCLQAWAKVVPTHGSKLRTLNKFDHLWVLMIRSSLLFILGILLYGIVLFVFSDLIAAVLFKEPIIGFNQLIFLWLLYVTVNATRLNATHGLFILKSFKLMFYISPLILIFNVLLGYIFVSLYDIRGSIIAMILTEVVVGLISWYYFFQRKKEAKIKFLNA